MSLFHPETQESRSSDESDCEGELDPKTSMEVETLRLMHAAL